MSAQAQVLGKLVPWTSKHGYTQANTSLLDELRPDKQGRGAPKKVKKLNQTLMSWV